MKVLQKIKVKVIIECDECAGTGYHVTPASEEPTVDENSVGCDVCQGTGFHEAVMPLLHIKGLLDGGEM